MWVKVPVVWVEVSEMVTKDPDTVKVETNEELVIEVRDMSRTLPVIAGVVTAVE